VSLVRRRKRTKGPPESWVFRQNLMKDPHGIKKKIVTVTPHSGRHGRGGKGLNPDSKETDERKNESGPQKLEYVEGETAR